MRDNYDLLKTEERNPRTMNIDKLSTHDMIQLMNNENRAVEDAIDTQIDSIAAAVDMISDAMAEGGHLIYVGAGTSGRLGVVDASECPPTFGVEPSLVRGIIAGGNQAMFHAVEGAEDSREWGRRSVDEDGISASDVVVGLSAAGRAPFVLGALERAREIGARTIGITCNPGAALCALCDITIAPYVGPEVISGSTRLKAGTAQKLVLNMLSTGVMIKTGRVRSNLMINVKPSNEKLIERATRIIMTLSGCERQKAEELLKKYGSVSMALDSPELKY